MSSLIAQALYVNIIRWCNDRDLLLSWPKRLKMTTLQAQFLKERRKLTLKTTETRNNDNEVYAEEDEDDSNCSENGTIEEKVT